jgi:hypothetical protein
VVQRGDEIITTTTYLTPTLSYGAFDPALGATAPLAVGLLILIVGALIEIALIVWYGSFYLGDSRSAYPLSLPLGTIRVLVIIMVILVLLVFAFLPAPWSENNAVLFLFGLLSTVVGFYFGSSTGRATGGNAARDNVTRVRTEGATVSVTGIQPATAPRGADVQLSITGQGFTAAAARRSTIAVDPPSNVAVGPVTFVDASKLQAKLTVEGTAQVGDRQVTVKVPNAPDFKGTLSIT